MTPKGPGSRARICSTFTDLSLRPLYHLAVTRIEISAAAYAALAASSTRGLLEASAEPPGQLFYLADPGKGLKRLQAVRRPSESYSVAIFRLAKEAAVAT